MIRSKPVLWHIPVSHYSEKARWALAYKRIEHGRRSPPPGIHMLVAMALTRTMRPTFPVLQIDGEGIGDSTAIIAALEHLHPERPLYPDDPDERRRALGLEDYFDERLGPQIRLLAWHDLIADAANGNGTGMGPVAASAVPGRLGEMAPVRAALTAYGTAYVKLRFAVSSDDRAAGARTAVLEALDRLEAELGDGDFLVGDTFTVADLTAAALFYPLVLPPEGPQILAEQSPSFAEFVDPLRERPGYAYVQRMFAEYR